MSRNWAWGFFAIGAFVTGVFIGQQNPRHHYQRIGQSVLLFDTSTGKSCAIAPIDDPYNETGRLAPTGYPPCPH